jgi:hypothetical protein
LLLEEGRAGQTEGGALWLPTGVLRFLLLRDVIHGVSIRVVG